jgi:hypothetical protein
VRQEARNCKIFVLVINAVFLASAIFIFMQICTNNARADLNTSLQNHEPLSIGATSSIHTYVSWKNKLSLSISNDASINLISHPTAIPGVVFFLRSKDSDYPTLNALNITKPSPLNNKTIKEITDEIIESYHTHGISSIEIIESKMVEGVAQTNLASITARYSIEDKVLQTLILLTQGTNNHFIITYIDEFPIFNERYHLLAKDLHTSIVNWGDISPQQPTSSVQPKTTNTFASNFKLFVLFMLFVLVLYYLIVRFKYFIP